MTTTAFPAAAGRSNCRRNPSSGGIIIAGIVSIAILIVLAHGCHGPEDDHEPAITPPFTSLAEESANESQNP